MLDDRQIEAGGQLLKKMQIPDALNEDAFGVLELLGLDDVSSAKVVRYLIDEQIIRKDGGGYNITSKGHDISTLNQYIKDKHTKALGEVLSGQKSTFDWRQRWWTHPLVTSLLGLIMGYLLGRLS